MHDSLIFWEFIVSQRTEYYIGLLSDRVKKIIAGKISTDVWGTNKGRSLTWISSFNRKPTCLRPRSLRRLRWRLAKEHFDVILRDCRHKIEQRGCKNFTQQFDQHKKLLVIFSPHKLLLIVPKKFQPISSLWNYSKLSPILWWQITVNTTHIQILSIMPTQCNIAISSNLSKWQIQNRTEYSKKFPRSVHLNLAITWRRKNPVHSS